ncbi:hypothetical protein [Mucisphaera calidilacus]|uniref:Uncharacterized protein n=1 Tax=Mucisphaera calidilacus TaxID=2527982 RepID=A0A518C1A2_9BACT|nr:hypothetical protein [Mucisphaera calidilacus]QDU73003.1 hypothetical protein Pan265_28810 [Mucisphaera calidilacus]
MRTIRTPLYPAIITAAAALLATPTTHAQTLNEIRAQLSDGLADTEFTTTFSGLILLSDELELTGTQLWINDDSDTRISAFSIPFARSFPLFGQDAPHLYVEAAVGYASATQSFSDIYEGAAPALATGVETKWSTLGAIVGAGPEFEILPELRLALIANANLAYLENRTTYSGPGRNVTAAIADGVAFNWNAISAGLGVATRLDYNHAFENDLELRCRARYDLRFTDTLTADDPAQDVTNRIQILTLRTDLTGPTGIDLLNQPLRWRTFVGYRNFIEGQLFGVTNYAQIGTGLELRDILPLNAGISVTAAYLIGDNAQGYALGAGLNF